MQKYLIFLLLVSTLAISAGAADNSYTCGNVDALPDGKVNLSDITYLISVVYLNADPPPISALANVDGSVDGKLNLADITRLIGFVYVDHAPLACPVASQDTRSECLVGNSALESGEMTLEVIGRNLIIHHTNAFYQCCLDYAVDYEIENFRITARESDIGDECDCYCYFDLESILYFLPQGEYEVILIGIENDTVGVDTALILPDFGLTNFENSGCLGDPPSSRSLVDVLYSYHAGQLTMEHQGAVFNCALDLDVVVVNAGDTIRFLERNMIPIDSIVKCLCEYNLMATVDGVVAGEYILEVYSHDVYLLDYYENELINRQTIVLEN